MYNYINGFFVCRSIAKNADEDEDFAHFRDSLLELATT